MTRAAFSDALRAADSASSGRIYGRREQSLEAFLSPHGWIYIRRRLLLFGHALCHAICCGSGKPRQARRSTLLSITLAPGYAIGDKTLAIVHVDHLRLYAELIQQSLRAVAAHEVADNLRSLFLNFRDPSASLAHLSQHRERDPVLYARSQQLCGVFGVGNCEEFGEFLPHCVRHLISCESRKNLARRSNKFILP